MDINKLQQSFDYMQDVLIDNEMISSNDSYIILSVYHKLNEKNKNLFLSLGPKKIKHLSKRIYKQMDGNIF